MEKLGGVGSPEVGLRRVAYKLFNKACRDKTGWWSG